MAGLLWQRDRTLTRAHEGLSKEGSYLTSTEHLLPAACSAQGLMLTDGTVITPTLQMGKGGIERRRTYLSVHSWSAAEAGPGSLVLQPALRTTVHAPR